VGTSVADGRARTTLGEQPEADLKYGGKRSGKWGGEGSGKGGGGKAGAWTANRSLPGAGAGRSRHPRMARTSV
jgi:hypothetical protein